jgi:hypothetical protein
MFDREVSKALSIESSEEDLTHIYETIVQEMIVTKGLQKD